MMDAVNGITGVFPTPVGMNRNINLAVLKNGRFPHTRGDEPPARGSRAAEIGRFPHTRGDEPK